MLKFINKNSKQLFYATAQSAGFDICANENRVLAPSEFAAISTGLFLDQDQSEAKKFIQEAYRSRVPLNIELQIRPRSGLAAKYGITVLNAPGTIDLDYRYPNEIKVLLINHGTENFEIVQGDRIAQGVVAWVFTGLNITVLEEDRVGGLGSTGV